jgi:hypothetical protein
MRSMKSDFYAAEISSLSPLFVSSRPFVRVRAGRFPSGLRVA